MENVINDSINVFEQIKHIRSINGWTITFFIIILPIVYEIIKSNLPLIKLIVL